LTIVEDSAKIEKFFVKGHDFDQLSDHYGIKISLQYSKNNDIDKEEMETNSSTASITYQSDN